MTVRADDGRLLTALGAFAAAREELRGIQLANKHAMRHPGRMVDTEALIAAQETVIAAYEAVIAIPAMTPEGLAAKVSAMLWLYPLSGRKHYAFQAEEWAGLVADIHRVCGQGA
jgi:hypothetical protein